MNRIPLSARVAMLLLGLLMAGSVLAPALSPWSPWDGDYVSGHMADGRPVGPCASHPLGTDRLLRDVLVRLALATRQTLVVALLACALTGVVSVLLGVLAGYYEKRLPDRAITWLTELALGFPALLVLMTVGSTMGRLETVGAACLMAAVSWPWMTVMMRARTADVCRSAYVEGAHALGQSTAGVIWHHVIPNVAPTAWRVLAMSVAPMVLFEASLAYVGVGSPPPAPTLGRMVYEGQDAVLGAPWLVIAPAAVVVWIGVCFTLLSNAIRIETRGAR